MLFQSLWQISLEAEPEHEITYKPLLIPFSMNIHMLGVRNNSCLQGAKVTSHISILESKKYEF